MPQLAPISARGTHLDCQGNTVESRDVQADTGANEPGDAGLSSGSLLEAGFVRSASPPIPIQNRFVFPLKVEFRIQAMEHFTPARTSP